MPHIDSEAAEIERLRAEDSVLATIPVKHPSDPAGAMLLLPIPTHVVVVPLEVAVVGSGRG